MQSLNWFLFSFRGRIGRQQFWLFQISVMAIALIVLNLFGQEQLTRLAEHPEDPEALAALVPILWKMQVFILWHKFAVDVKRLHDRNKPWFWLFIQLLPLVGPIWYLLELGLLPGTQGNNRFGAPLGRQQQPATNSTSSPDRFDA